MTQFSSLSLSFNFSQSLAYAFGGAHLRIQTCLVTIRLRHLLQKPLRFGKKLIFTKCLRSHHTPPTLYATRACRWINAPLVNIFSVYMSGLRGASLWPQNGNLVNRMLKTWHHCPMPLLLHTFSGDTGLNLCPYYLYSLCLMCGDMLSWNLVSHNRYHRLLNPGSQFCSHAEAVLAWVMDLDLSFS